MMMQATDVTVYVSKSIISKDTCIKFAYTTIISTIYEFKYTILSLQSEPMSILCNNEKANVINY